MKRRLLTDGGNLGIERSEVGGRAGFSGLGTKDLI